MGEVDVDPLAALLGPLRPPSGGDDLARVTIVDVEARFRLVVQAAPVDLAFAGEGEGFAPRLDARVLHPL
ncbi:MAG: hypothetical protein AAGA56_17780, partial [Myxococcota bacterium]